MGSTTPCHAVGLLFSLHGTWKHLISLPYREGVGGPSDQSESLSLPRSLAPSERQLEPSVLCVPRFSSVFFASVASSFVSNFQGLAAATFVLTSDVLFNLEKFEVIFISTHLFVCCAWFSSSWCYVGLYGSEFDFVPLVCCFVAVNLMHDSFQLMISVYHVYLLLDDTLSSPKTFR